MKNDKEVKRVGTRTKPYLYHLDYYDEVEYDPVPEVHYDEQEE